MSETQQEATTQADATSQDEGASFEGEFDADKAQKLIKALRAEKRTLQAKMADAAPKLSKYDEMVAAQQSDAERWQTYAKQFEERADKAERELLRSRVALEKGLPPNLAARLQGDDEAALAADADELMALMPRDTTSRAPRPDMSQGSSSKGGGAAQPRDQFAALLNQQLGR